MRGMRYWTLQRCRRVVQPCEGSHDCLSNHALPGVCDRVCFFDLRGIPQPHKHSNLINHAVHEYNHLQEAVVCPKEQQSFSYM